MEHFYSDRVVAERHKRSEVVYAVSIKQNPETVRLELLRWGRRSVKTFISVSTNR